VTKQEFIRATRQKTVDKESIAKFEARVEKREKQFDSQSRKQVANKEFMARTYNL
jgi:hypothetical protein